MRLWALLLVMASSGTAQSSGSPSTWYGHGIAVLRPGASYLDLDDHALRDRRRHLEDRDAELTVREGKIHAFVALKELDESALADWPYPNLTWSRLKTSAGKRAWIRVLRRRKALTVEFIVEHGKVLESPPPAPVEAYAIGKEDGVHIHAALTADLETAVLEGLDEDSGLFVKLSDFDDKVAIDSRRRAGSRRRYRIRCRFRDGRRAPDRLLVGGPSSGGVVEGSRLMSRGQNAKGIDFLSGDLVQGIPDLVLVDTFVGASGASFQDWTGGYLTPATADGTLDPWGRDASPRQIRIPPDTPFFVPLRGGGLARCFWTPDSSREVRLHYIANPNGTRLAVDAEVQVQLEQGQLRVRLVSQERLKISDVRAEDLSSPVGSRRSLDKDEASDAWILSRVPETCCLELKIQIEDEWGRRLPSLRRHFDQREESITSGTFRLTPGGMGFAFASGSPRQGRGADLSLRSLRVSHRSYSGSLVGEARLSTLLELFRVVNDPSLRPFQQRTKPPTLSSLRMFSPRLARMFKNQTRISSRRWAEHYLTLRTRDEGWAVVRVINKSGPANREDPGWLEFEYIYNPRRPVFGDFEVPLGKNEALRFVK